MTSMYGESGCHSLHTIDCSVHADPENEEIKAKIDWTSKQDSKGLPTVPSTIAVSLLICNDLEQIQCIF